MTNVIIIGSSAVSTEKSRKIEFLELLTTQKTVITSLSEPRQWKNIELICQNYYNSPSDGFDLMFAYDDDRNKGVLFLGRFNEGII